MAECYRDKKIERLHNMSFIQMEGKHILVSGGTSGIGQQTAITLSELGARVAVIGRREEKLQETLIKLNGEEHSIHAVDMSDLEVLEEKVKGIVSQTGAFDGYVHCAGIVNNLPIKNYTPARLDQIMRTNFYSYFEMVRILSKKGRFNEGMSIVGVSSISAYVGTPAQAAYGASKAAMNGAMHCLARELGEKKIRLNTVLPGPTETAMYNEYLALKSNTKESSSTTAKSSGRNYLGMNLPSDVANAIIFLLSPISRTITGVELPVDGGYMAC